MTIHNSPPQVSPSLGGGTGEALSEETLFIHAHREDDVRKVALLAAKRSDIDGHFVAEQIAGWQKARTKLPSWADTEGIIFPPQTAMEQCSSEVTARYKAELVKRLVEHRHSLIDLTGGFGIDHAAMAPLFDRSIFIERQERLCDIARHNFLLLHLQHTDIIHADCTEVLSDMPHADLIYADPARRDTQGRRTYAITDCTPDICSLMPMLLQQADLLLIKLSPMLDWHQTVDEINRAAQANVVREVHIVAVGNECKELLVVVASPVPPPKEGGINRGKSQDGFSKLMMYCVNDDEVFSFCPEKEQRGSVPMVGGEEPLEGSWLYEPNAALMKGGCFDQVCHRYGVRALAANSHLFVAANPIEDFPGRCFRIEAVGSMNRHDLRIMLKGVTRANITVRNFPMSVADLRRRLRLADGGDTFIFATTRSDGKRVILSCIR